MLVKGGDFLVGQLAAKRTKLVHLETKYNLTRGQYRENYHLQSKRTSFLDLPNLKLNKQVTCLSELENSFFKKGFSFLMQKRF